MLRPLTEAIAIVVVVVLKCPTLCYIQQIIPHTGISKHAFPKQINYDNIYAAALSVRVFIMAACCHIDDTSEGGSTAKNFTVRLGDRSPLTSRKCVSYQTGDSII